jgi:hypothetical protein
MMIERPSGRFYCRLALYCEKQQKPCHCSLALYCAFSFALTMLTTISRTLFLASGALFGLAALLYEPPFKPDHAGYQQCVTVHPERYCGITYLGGR